MVWTIFLGHETLGTSFQSQIFFNVCFLVFWRLRRATLSARAVEQSRIQAGSKFRRKRNSFRRWNFFPPTDRSVVALRRGSRDSRTASFRFAVAASVSANRFQFQDTRRWTDRTPTTKRSRRCCCCFWSNLCSDLYRVVETGVNSALQGRHLGRG